MASLSLIYHYFHWKYLDELYFLVLTIRIFMARTHHVTNIPSVFQWWEVSFTWTAIFLWTTAQENVSPQSGLGLTQWSMSLVQDENPVKKKIECLLNISWLNWQSHEIWIDVTFFCYLLVTVVLVGTEFKYAVDMIDWLLISQKCLKYNNVKTDFHIVKFKISVWYKSVVSFTF